MTPPAPNKIGHFRILDQDRDGVFSAGDRIISPEGKDLNFSCGEVKKELKRLGIDSLQGLRLAPLFSLNRFRNEVESHLDGDGTSVEDALTRIGYMESMAHSAGAVLNPEVKVELKTRVLLNSLESFWNGPRF